MISHCLPQRGPGARGRAWRLLETAAKTHDVYLLAQADAPITLAEWRAAERKCHRLALATSRGAKAMRTTASAWLGEEPFDAMVCTTPRLLQQTMTVPATHRICDAGEESAGGVLQMLARGRDAWLARRAAAQGGVVLHRDGIDSFLDTLGATDDTSKPTVLRQAA